MAGSGNARCRPCSLRDAGRSRGELLAAAFEQAWLRSLWLAFVDHVLGSRVPSTRINARLEGAARYFDRLGAEFPSERELTASSLAERIDSRFARQHLLASRFVTLTLAASKQHIEGPRGGMAVERVTEARRLNAILVRSAGQWFAPLLVEYEQALRDQGVATRTSRLYVRAAEGFCAFIGRRGVSAIDQTAVQSFLEKSPGSGASLSRFLRHCRERRGLEVSLPRRTSWASSGEERTIKRVRRLRQALVGSGHVPVSEMSTRQVARVLSDALGMSAAQLLRLRKSGAVTMLEGGAVQIAESAVLGPDHPMHEFALRWATLAAADALRTR